MGEKHDKLTEAELSSYNVDGKVLRLLDEIMVEKGKTAAEIRVLDWGCGRGRSVAKLRQLGFQAYGVEIDRKTMLNGFSLFRECGLDPDDLLRDVCDASDFESVPFDLIFTEQVFEHIADMEDVAGLMGRLTKSGGKGVHMYPSRRSIEEEHLFMPFIHWLPKHPIRKPILWIMMAFGKGPKTGWPGVLDLPRSEQVEIFYDYLDQKTYYRDNSNLMNIFENLGFEAKVIIAPQRCSKFDRITPNSWLRNGFPNGTSTLYVTKTS
jgi:SAM-dependent methyltransferase